MGVAVYPRLGGLLRTRGLSVAELGRQIENRLGRAADPKTLYRLAADAPIQRADLEVAGAIVSILDVRLDDLFDIKVDPVELADEGQNAALDPEQARRMAELFGRQATGTLLPTEQHELETLVAAYGRNLHEQRLREYALRQNMSQEEAREKSANLLDEAQRWWQSVEEDPAKRSRLVGKRRRHIRNAPA